MTRREFSPKIKALAFERAAGRCEKCTARLFVGKFHYDHVIPDSHGGSPTLENCAVLCVACHGEKTPSDITTAAKLKRISAKHNSYQRKTGRPMPGSKASGIRKRMDGTVERRT